MATSRTSSAQANLHDGGLGVSESIDDAAASHESLNAPTTKADIAASYTSYEEYLDSQITPTDLFYVEVFYTYCLLTWEKRMKLTKEQKTNMETCYGV